MAENERDKDKNLLISQSYLWDMVCSTVVPFHGRSVPSIKEEIRSVYSEQPKIMQAALHVEGHKKQYRTFKKMGEVAKEVQKVSRYDPKTYRKIAKENFFTDAWIDLHGLTQNAAYSSLKEFLQSSQQRGLRHVLVITGKGRSYGSDGVLCRFVPYWLSTSIFQCYVYAFEQAARKHGGYGAVYVWLRRLYK
ncbi:Smr/MutS family protein [Bartonella ancashensis]|nr:Smr/MutS family protein [Bartonella ancashensis]